MSSILITGASGFIGSHLTRHLVHAGASVHALVRGGRANGRLADLDGKLEVWDVDLRDRDAVERAVAAAKPRFVYHLASTPALRWLDEKLEGVRESVEANVLGTMHLVLALHRTGATERFVRTSSLEEYGHGPAPHLETQREDPVSPYSASLVSVTHYLQMLERALAFEAVTLRLALTYGPDQSERFFIPGLIRACLDGRTFRMTSGEQHRDYIYVDDVVEALTRAAATPGLGGDVINVGTGRAPKIADVARRIVRLCGKGEIELGAADERSFEIQNFLCDPTRARERMGYVATTDLDTGLARTIDWMRTRKTAGS